MSGSKYNFDLYQSLSAYLDGELPTARVEKIEQILAQDPQARQIFDELQKTAQKIKSIPIESAGPELAENVLRDLERQQLLDGTDMLKEISGHRHLRLRKFFAAAAVIALCGGMVAMIFQALSTKPDMPESKIIADATPAPEPPIVEPVFDPILLQILAFDDEAITPSPTIFSTMNLLINIDNASQYLTAENIKNILSQNNIDDVVSHIKPDEKICYSFMCSLAEFQNIFSELAQQNNIAISVPAPFGTGNLIARNVESSEALLLAELTSSKEQAFMMLAQIPHEKIFSPLILPQQPDLAQAAFYPGLFNLELLSNKPVLEQNTGLPINIIEPNDQTKPDKKTDKVAVILEINIEPLMPVIKLQKIDDGQE